MQERDEELEKYFDSMKELCNYLPFIELQKDWNTQAHQINSVEATKDENDLYFRKGQLSIIATLLNLRTSIDTLEENYLKELQGDEVE